MTETTAPYCVCPCHSEIRVSYRGCCDDAHSTPLIERNIDLVTGDTIIRTCPLCPHPMHLGRWCSEKCRCFTRTTQHFATPPLPAHPPHDGAFCVVCHWPYAMPIAHHEAITNQLAAEIERLKAGRKSDYAYIQELQAALASKDVQTHAQLVDEVTALRGRLDRAKAWMIQLSITVHDLREALHEQS